MSNVRKVCGHPRRGWAKCECPWHFHFKWQGTHHRFSLDKHLNRHIDSKSVAEDEAATIRKAIKAGTFGQVVPRQEMTLRQLVDTYVERYINVRHADTATGFTYRLNTVCKTAVPRPAGGSAPLGDWRVTDLVTDTVERYREIRLGEKANKGISVNRELTDWRAMFNWAIRTGYVKETPFKIAGQSVIKLAREERRTRRLQDGEEAKLLAVAGPHLRAVIECALTTGMRRGEILGLQWADVVGMKVEEDRVTWASRPGIVLPATKTKTKKNRRIPISERLKAILEMRRLDPAGQPLPLDKFVFGTELGTQVTNFKRAWMTAVLRAHGHDGTYSKKTKNLEREWRDVLAQIDLHFHDLRREAGSRWLEGGVPLHTIKEWLGHSNIAQTSTYLACTGSGQDDAMRRFEEHETALQLLATAAKTGGRKRPASAEPRPEKARKSAVGRDLPTVQ